VAGELAVFARQLIAAAPHPAQHLADEVVHAADALAAAPSQLTRQRWEAAVRALGADPVRLLLKAWGLDEMPGAAQLLGGYAEQMLRGDQALLSGIDVDLRLGALELSTNLPALVVTVPGLPPIVAGLKPPTDAAGSVAAGPVVVTGGLHTEPDGWSGSLSAQVGVVSAGALALLADSSGTTAFAAVLGARFTPGIQLGFGFEISSLGGVVGINVAADADALRAALSSGAALGLFFPAAPAAAADRRARLQVLTKVFPVRDGSMVAGPSAELTWLQVAGQSALRLSLVALLELPRGRFLLLGRAAVAIPVVLDLQLDVMGEIDPAAGLMAVDLAVVSGRMFGLLRVDGTAAMRVRTSDPAAALFTLGGFYPGFRADIPGLPPQRRLSIGTDLPLPLTFRYEGYLAVTDGTFQAGARVEVGFDAGISVHGFLQFDAIGHYDPFHVHARLAGGVDVGALGVDFGGVDFEGVIDGPGPVVVSGEVSVSFLGAEAGWHDSFRIGDAGGSAAQPPVVDLLGLMVTGAERGGEDDPLEVPRGALVPSEAADPLVAVRAVTRDEDGLAVVPPLGSVVWSQTVAPFDTPLQRVRGRRLADAARLTLTGLGPGLSPGPTEQFAPAALRDADRDQLLTLPAYERMASGVTVQMPAADVGVVRAGSIAYDEYYKPEAIRQDGLHYAISPALIGVLAACAAAPVAAPRGPSVVVRPEVWAVVSPGADRRTGTVTAAVFTAADAGVTAVPASQAAINIDGLWGP